MSILRFTLRDEDGIDTFGTESVSNWEAVAASLVRSETYKGRVSRITEPISFVKGIRTRIMSMFDRFGGDAEGYILIEVGNENLDEFSFSGLGNCFEMKIDYSSIEVTELNCSVMLNDSSFQELLFNGEKEKLNLTTSKSLTGVDVTDWQTLLKDVTVRDRELGYNSKLNFISQEYADIQEILDVGDRITFQLPYLAVTSPEGSGIVDGNNISTLNGSLDELVATTSFLFNAPEDTITNVDLASGFSVSGVFFGSTEATISIIISYIWISKDDVIKEAVELGNKQVSRQVVGDNWNVSYDIALQRSGLLLEKGDSLILNAEIRVVDTVVDLGLGNIAVVVDSENYYLDVNSTSSYQDTISKCLLPHELFTHWIELITGRKNAFYSDVFGRTDILNDDGTPKYAQDGEWAYLTIMDGHMLRNLNISEHPFNTSMVDAFKALDSILCLAGQIEYKGNTEVFRIEKYTDLLSPADGVNLGELIAEPSRTINEERTFSRVKIGYLDKEPESSNGLTIYNGEVNYSTPLTSVDKELNKVCTWIAASEIIEETRRKQFVDFPELDTKFDKDIFVLECFLSNDNIISRRSEGFVFVDGTLSPTKATNLRITPARNLIRWGSYISACLYTSLGAQVGTELLLTKSASNNALETQTTAEAEPLNEGENIPINTLDKPIEINENITLGDAVVDKNIYDDVFNNINKAVKFTYKGQEFSGFVSLINYNPSEKNANFELNRAKG